MSTAHMATLAMPTVEEDMLQPLAPVLAPDATGRMVLAGGAIPAALLPRIAAEVVTDLWAFHHRLGLAHGCVRPESVLTDDGDVVIFLPPDEADTSAQDYVPLLSADSESDDDDEHVGADAFCYPALAARGYAAVSAAFRPPEARETYEGSSSAGDMWALGVTLYALRYGQLPFLATDHPASLQAVAFNDALEPTDEDIMVQRQWRALLRSLLTPEPAERLSARDVLRHPLIRPAVETLPFEND